MAHYHYEAHGSLPLRSTRLTTTTKPRAHAITTHPRSHVTHRYVSQFEKHEIGLGTDMWAIGVLGYILLSGYHPFDPYGDASDEVMQKRICRNTYDFDDPAWRDVSDEVTVPCNVHVTPI